MFSVSTRQKISSKENSDFPTSFWALFLLCRRWFSFSSKKYNFWRCVLTMSFFCPSVASLRRSQVRLNELLNCCNLDENVNGLLVHDCNGHGHCTWTHVRRVLSISGCDHITPLPTPHTQFGQANDLDTIWTCDNIWYPKSFPTTPNTILDKH